MADTMGPMELTIEGLEPLLETFGAYFSDVDTSPIIEAAIKEIAQNIASRAQDILQEKIYNTPESPSYRRTGHLKTRTVADKKIERDAKGNLEILVRSLQEYAADVELGTRRPNPRPFLLPAGQTEVPISEKIFEDALLEFLDSKIAKPL